MSAPLGPRCPGGRVLTWILSAPSLVKIMGTGALVALIFGGVTLYQVRRSLNRTLRHILEEKTICPAVSLASAVERPLVTGDLFAVQAQLMRAVSSNPEIRYILVEDPAGKVVVHTFEGPVPKDLVGLRASPLPQDRVVEVYDAGEGHIFEAAIPIVEGRAGRLRLGMSDDLVVRESASLTNLLLLTLGLCVVIGLGLAFLLSYIQTRPIRDLVEATNRIAHGDFASRARVSAYDEIGKLAIAFNHMAGGLERSRREILEKEVARLALIEKTVSAQEEERRSIARDLHDQLGQSLSALLLEIQSLESGNGSDSRLAALEKSVSHLIDDVRRLAWGMHPSILDDYGLDRALARYIGDVSRHSGLPIDYQSVYPADSDRLPIGTEVALYRISQEAVTNIIRHAEASHASVVLLRRDHETLLLVEDDGKGFDPGKIDREAPGHLGLVGMRERAALLGGEFFVDSKKGSGTTVRVRIPQ